METMGTIFGFLIFVLVLPAALLWGGHWVVTTITPGFAAALAGMAPYLLWFVAWAAIARLALLIFADVVD